MDFKRFIFRYHSQNITDCNHMLLRDPSSLVAKATSRNTQHHKACLHACFSPHIAVPSTISMLRQSLF